jgi:ABC-type nitrate/sulfonate/bicarbonate transport system permease component
MASLMSPGTVGNALGNGSDGRPLLPGRRSRRSRVRMRPPLSPWLNVTIGAASVVVVIAAWQGSVELGLVGSDLVSSPSAALQSLRDYVHDGALFDDLRISGYEFLVGYALATVVGILFGVLLGASRFVSAAGQPLVSAAYAIPHVALIPLFVVWFGIGENSKIVICFIEAVFPILLGTMAGVRQADAALVGVARAFGAGQFNLMRTVVLPGAVPYIIAGMRLGVGKGIIGVVIGEMLAGVDGIGYEIQNAGQTFQIQRVFAAVFVLAAISMALMSLLGRVERYFQKWRPEA